MLDGPGAGQDDSEKGPDDVQGSPNQGRRSVVDVLGSIRTMGLVGGYYSLL